MHTKTMPTLAAAALTAMLAAMPLHAAMPEPIQAYKEASTKGITNCQLITTSNIALAKFKIPTEGGLAECVAGNKTATKAAYEAATKTIKPAVRGALKEHLVGTFAALDGIDPLIGESEPAYEARQRARETRLMELWARVEIEL